MRNDDELDLAGSDDEEGSYENDQNFNDAPTEEVHERLAESFPVSVFVETSGAGSIGTM